MREMVARDVMNPEVLSVRDDMSVTDLAEFLTDNEISGAPVEDAEGRLVGVVSLTDVAAAFTGQRDQAVLTHGGADFYLRSWEEKFNAEDLAGLRIAESEATVGEIMTPSIFAVEDETPISAVAERMIHSHIHRLLVTREHKVVGIVTTSDLLGLLVEAREAGA
ncbi:MAG: CBS domain-containing protein [Thermoanaerobaculia bacterium]|nr:CBS domain-containing protein [Thermoanaerobaculia bacterium]